MTIYLGALIAAITGTIAAAAMWRCLNLIIANYPRTLNKMRVISQERVHRFEKSHVQLVWLFRVATVVCGVLAAYSWYGAFTFH